MFVLIHITQEHQKYQLLCSFHYYYNSIFISDNKKPLFFSFQIVYWDEKTLFIEQQFIGLRDNFVHAIVLSRQSTIGLNVIEIMSKLTGKPITYKPEIPEELQDWLISIEKSSAKLKKNN